MERAESGSHIGMPWLEAEVPCLDSLATPANRRIPGRFGDRRGGWAAAGRRNPSLAERTAKRQQDDERWRSAWRRTARRSAWGSV